MPSLLLAALLIVLFLEAPTRAQGQDDAPKTHLTSQGRIMVGGQLSGFWSNDAPALYGSYDTWTVRATPSLVYFLRENLGVGGSLSGSMARGEYFRDGDYKNSELGFGCELVWNRPLTRRWSFMLRPYIGYGHAWSSSVASLSNASTFLIVDLQRTRNYVRFASSFPFVYALSDAIGIGVGPDLLFDVMFAQKVEADVAAGPPIVPTSSNSGTTRAQLGASVALYASF